MKFNLSLVLDEHGKVRLDLISNQPLYIIDQYTSSKNNHNDIRNDYRERINHFLDLNKNYISAFKKETNKKGSIVITYIDIDNDIRKLRVLYNKNINKLDHDKLIIRIYNSLKKLNDIDKTIELINRFSNQIFNSDFDKKIIISNKRKIKNIKNIENADIRNKKIKSINNNLLLFIKNKFIYLNTGSTNQQEIGYYYLRLIDSYIEKQFKISTTSEIIKSKISNLNIEKNNLAIFKENITFNNQKLYEEKTGQLSMFDINQNKKHNKIKLKELDYLNKNYDREDGDI